MCLGVQPQPFFKALTSIGKTVWMDSGFAGEVSLYDCETIHVNLLQSISEIFGIIILPKYSRKIFVPEIFFQHIIQNLSLNF